MSAVLSASTKDHSHCSGCSLCVLVCPVWRGARDLRMTPEGRCKALQNGAAVADIADSLSACTLCSACEAVCPEEINLVGQVLALRSQLPEPAHRETALERLHERLDERTDNPRSRKHAKGATLLLPDAAMRSRATLLARMAEVLGAEPAVDDGDDVILALEVGVSVPQARVLAFLDALAGAGRLIAAEGLLVRQLREWRPGVTVLGIGEALSSLTAVRQALLPTDLYVIEPRAYHAGSKHDRARMVGHYDALRRERGCAMNLDLQRVAVPVDARGLAARLDSRSRPRGDKDVSRAWSQDQAEWIMQGRSVQRVVVESLKDGEIFRNACTHPVIHVAELLES